MLTAHIRTGIGIPLICLTLGLASSAAAQGDPARVKRQFNKRGVYFFKGPQRCPLAGLGKRGDYDSNRLALDDNHSLVTWDSAGRKLVLRNTRSYSEETQVGGILLLGTGTTAKGKQVPVGVHLSISKEKNAFVTSIHAHVSVREKIKQGSFLGLQVVLDNGIKRTVALTKTRGLQALRKPFADSTLALIIGLKGVDNLEGQKIDFTKPGARLADGSVGIGHGFLSKLVLQAQMVSLDGSKPLAAGENWANLFNTGGYQLRLTALSSLLPSDVWKRNLFLLGLEGIPILKNLEKNGLEDGQTLTFTFRSGAGTIGLDTKSHPVPDAAEAVRRYLEFDFVGGIICHQMRQRLTQAQPLTSK
jgi:hypothetical protein